MISLHVQDATEKFLRLNEWSQGLEVFISHVLVALSVTRNLTLLQSVKVINLLEKWKKYYYTIINNRNIQIYYVLISNINVLGPDNEIYCKSCYSFEFGAKARFRPRAGRMNR